MRPGCPDLTACSHGHFGSEGAVQGKGKHGQREKGDGLDVKDGPQREVEAEGGSGKQRSCCATPPFPPVASFTFDMAKVAVTWF